MAITIVAGLNTYPIAISASYTGAAGSETPDGSTIYLNPMEWSDSYKAGIKRKPKINGASGYRSGIRDIQVSLTSCKVAKDVGASTTVEKNNLNDFFYTYALEVGAPKAYLFIKHISNNTYEKLSWSSGGVHQQYLLGSFLQWKFKPNQGKLYEIDINFGEITTP